MNDTAMVASQLRQIDRILDIARGVAPIGPADRENREATRLAFTGPVALVLLLPAGGRTSPVVLKGENISSGGLGVLSRRELSVGSRGAIMVARSDGEQVILGARVVYSNTLGPKGFECGLEFDGQPAGISREDFQDPNGELPKLAA